MLVGGGVPLLRPGCGSASTGLHPASLRLLARGFHTSTALARCYFRIVCSVSRSWENPERELRSDGRVRAPVRRCGLEVLRREPRTGITALLGATCKDQRRHVVGGL